MRQYRGIRKDNGEWVYGYYVKINNIHYIVLDKLALAVNCGEDSCFYISAFQHFIKVIPETVGQSTGLKDKHGKEIYEGDKVKFEGFVGEFYEEGRREMLVGEVFYKTEGSVDYCLGVYGHNYGLNSNDVRKYEIIGNIHDNPELLEQE